MTVKHFADCLSVFKYVDFKEGAKLIDVGTGAGFPGLVLLLARPDLDVTFLDGTGKKLAFIESVLSNVGLNGNILHSRAEEAGKDPLYRENSTLQRQGLWRLCPSFANIAYLLLKGRLFHLYEIGFFRRRNFLCVGFSSYSRRQNRVGQCV